MENLTPRRIQLTQDYAAFSKARLALGSAWAGVIALWPIWELISRHLAFDYWRLYSIHFGGVIALFSLPLWIGGRAFLARMLYQPHGEVTLIRQTNEQKWNLLITSIIIMVGISLSIFRLYAVPPHALPDSISDSRFWELRNLPIWLALVAWIGLRHLYGWEDRLVFLWLGLLGARYVTMNMEAIPMSIALVLGHVSSFFLSPWLIVRGIREHRRFIRIVKDIQSLPSVEC